MSRHRDAAPPIYVDDAGKLRPIRGEHGERLNFLFSQLQQARANDADAETLRAANAELFKEVIAYSGIPGRKEADRHGNHLPGSDSPKDPLDELYGREWRKEIATRVFLKLDTFKGKSSFQTWVYRVITNELSDLITERKKHRGLQIFEWSKNVGVDAEGKPLSNASHNVAEERFMNNFGGSADPAEESPVLKGKTPKQIQAAYDAADKLYAAQSKKDRQFLEMMWEKGALYIPTRLSRRALVGKNRIQRIALSLNWPIKKIYNRIAKFKKMGLLPATTPDLRKREYNRRYKAKLAKRKTGGLSSEGRAENG